MHDETVERCFRYALIGRSGRRWYRVARTVIGRLTDHWLEHCNTGVWPKLTSEKARSDHRTWAYGQLCDIVALTSPRCAVTRNLRLAWSEFRGEPRPADLMRPIRAALDHYYATGEIRGPKTSRFARVLRGGDDCIVVDTWMARALNVPDRQARNLSTQRLAERVVFAVCKRLSRATGIKWTLAETQAAIWCGAIRTFYKDGKVPLFSTRAVGLHADRSGKLTDVSDVPF